jgi:hypothetical protein
LKCTEDGSSNTFDDRRRAALPDRLQSDVQRDGVAHALTRHVDPEAARGERLDLLHGIAVGGIDHVVSVARAGLVLAGRGASDDEDLAGAGGSGRRQGDEPDWPRPDDRRRVTCSHPAAPDGVYGDRQQLQQRALIVSDRVRKHVHWTET